MRPQISWKAKSLGFKIFDTVPAGRHLHYFFQKHVTREIPRQVKPLHQKANNFRIHVKNFRDHLGDLSDKIYFEFGAGWDLFSNLLMYRFGVSRQITVDIAELARLELINRIIASIGAEPLPGAVRELPWKLSKDYRSDLLRIYGIDYRAPCDAARTGIEAGSIDMIASTNTLEHIPRDVIGNIMRECHRLSHVGTVLSFKIDYSDHYASFDRSITPYNFLSFSEAAWHTHNHRSQYLNRMRHSDYYRIIVESGFEIASEEKIYPENYRELLSRVRLAAEWRDYEEADLGATGGRFVLRKNRASAP